MSVPSTVPQTIPGYIEYLGDTINLADKMWTHYGLAVSAAYATAYKKQQETLSRIKKALERQKQEDYNRMSFALSVLTVGVAGGVAGAVARFVYESKDIQDAAKDVIKATIQKRGALIDSLSPDKTVSGVFVTDDTTPEEYTTKLLEGITYNVGLLTKILYEVKWDPKLTNVTYDSKDIKLKSGGQLSFDEVKNLTEAIVDSSFMKEMPSLDGVTSEKLTKKALLALWIGWALARDARYWTVPQTNAPANLEKRLWTFRDLRDVTDGFYEQYTWEPLRHELATLGVPLPTITANIVMQDVGWGRSGMYEEFPGLYMWGFMKWAASPLSMAQLFDSSLPKNAKGFEKVKEQMSRRVLNPIWGWIDLKP
jgi:hypothetical protein